MMAAYEPTGKDLLETSRTCLQLALDAVEEKLQEDGFVSASLLSSLTRTYAALYGLFNDDPGTMTAEQALNLLRESGLEIVPIESESPHE